MNFEEKNIGKRIYKRAKDLFPIPRSLTGPGVRETLNYIRNEIPELQIKSVPSGTQVFDWKTPDEWTLREAWIADSNGNKIIDFTDHNLHIVGYSISVDQKMELSELQNHLYSIPEQPNAIPYITSYYKKRWGFCLTQKQRDSLKNGVYHVFIDSDLKQGILNYGEIFLKGESNKEIFLSTYICHPSMGNNELSGPTVTMELINYIKKIKNRKYSYRVVFIPETIGSITYLSKKVEHLKQSVIAGFNITCVGDNFTYSYLPSRQGNTLSDRAALHVLNNMANKFIRYSWLDRGSDERQYCAPGVDLPICSMMRSKYGEYPEYHTSLDDLNFISADGLFGGYTCHKLAIDCIENNCIPIANLICEPQLGKRGLYPTISSKGHTKEVKTMMDFISYCDGKNDLIDIAELIKKSMWEIIPILNRLMKEGIISTKQSV